LFACQSGGEIGKGVIERSQTIMEAEPAVEEALDYLTGLALVYFHPA
jgi:hypothetical protein